MILYIGVALCIVGSLLIGLDYIWGKIENRGTSIDRINREQKKQYDRIMRKWYK